MTAALAVHHVQQASGLPTKAESQAAMLSAKQEGQQSTVKEDQQQQQQQLSSLDHLKPVELQTACQSDDTVQESDCGKFCAAAEATPAPLAAAAAMSQSSITLGGLDDIAPNRVTYNVSSSSQGTRSFDAQCIMIDSAKSLSIKMFNEQRNSSCYTSCSTAATWRQYRKVTQVGVDAVALGLILFGVLVGGSENRHTATLGFALDAFTAVMGRAIFSAGLAWVLGSALLGCSRFRVIAWLLSWQIWLPIASLSYGAYLLQDLPMSLTRSFANAGATTMFAAWAVYYMEFVYMTVLCLVLAIPFNVTVEMPFQRMLKRGY